MIKRKTEWRIKAIRAQLGLTQEEMANLLGISVLSYAKKEKGDNDWKGMELINISKISGVSLNDMRIS